MDSKIVVHTIDDIGPDADDMYCAVVMNYDDDAPSNGWFNSGIVVREDTPEKAFGAALKRAIKDGLWK